MKSMTIIQSLAIALAIGCAVSLDASAAESNVACRWKIERNVQVGNQKQDYLVEDVPPGVKGWRLRLAKNDTRICYDSRCDIRQEGEHTDVDFSMLDGSEGSLCKLVGISGFENSGVTSVKLPDTLADVSFIAFAGCKSLTRINLSKVTTIGSNAFSGSGLEGVVDLRSLTSIEVNCFKGSKKLAGMQIDPNRITKIAGSAFEECTNFTGDIVLSNVTAIEQWAFKDTKITGIEAPKVKRVDRGAFSNCSKLRRVVLPEVETIMDGAFSGRSDIEELDFPKAKTIKRGAFKGSGVRRASLPAVSELEFEMFSGCSNLEHIEIGNVRSISGLAFEGCVSLKTIKFSYCLTNVANNILCSSYYVNPILVHARSPLAYDMMLRNFEFHDLPSTQHIMMYGGAVIENGIEWYYDDCDTPDYSVSDVLTIVAAPNAKVEEMQIPTTLAVAVNNNKEDLVKKKVTAIAAGAFKNNAELKRIKIPKTVVRIGFEAVPMGCKISLEKGGTKTDKLLAQLKAEYGEANVSVH